MTFREAIEKIKLPVHGALGRWEMVFVDADGVAIPSVVITNLLNAAPEIQRILTFIATGARVYKVEAQIVLAQLDAGVSDAKT